MFNIGDRVALRIDHPDGNGFLHQGDEGEIICGGWGAYAYGVRFDIEFPNGHDLDGNISDNHGWFVHKEDIVPVEDTSNELSPVADVAALFK